MKTEQRYEKILYLTASTIAHPHKLVTPHDLHRALVIISFLSNDDEMVEYLYSQLSQVQHDQVKSIRTQITND